MVSSSPECKGEDTVKQTAGDVRATEGGTVTLGCKFQTSNTAYLFWYKQEVNGYPKYMLKRYSGGGDNAAEFQKDRFDAILNKPSVPLQISSAAVTDSAVYYCALQPTVTGNTTTLYKNLWSKDNTILHNIHQREPLSVRLQQECRAQRDNVLQPEAEKTATKGEAVTLGCHYNTTSTNYYLFWYKQHGDNSPTFILSRFKIGTGKTEDEDRFSSTLDSSLRSVPLKIQKLQLSDSAVYYCALRPTVTGNTNTLYKNLWSKDNTILHNIHQREPLSVRLWEIRHLKEFRQATGDNAAEFKKDRFDATLNETSVPLQISSAAVTDSAVYYCALKPTRKNFHPVLGTNSNTSSRECCSLPCCPMLASVTCEDLTPVKTEEFSSEGSIVTLSYKAGSGAKYYFWYRQYPGKPPEFLISHSVSGTVGTNPIPGLKITVESNRINLIISSAAVTDSAVYYCALRPTTHSCDEELQKLIGHLSLLLLTAELHD
ncbi:hypothetical protein NQZ68_038536 [Dissostichus eleginoides]|nr:hypothetical protein NQZ68_038536 [Dissostichus eleginoides]